MNQYLIWNGTKVYTWWDIIFNKNKKGLLAKPGPHKTPEDVIIEVYYQTV